MSISSILSIAARALLAEQVGVEVVSHNIANVNTEGYSRQQVELVTNPALDMPWGQQGNGVKVAGISRFFDPYIALRLNQKIGSQSDYATRQSELEKIAEYFNETEDNNINDLLSQFWNSWQDLADNPTGSAERQSVLQNGQLIAESFNSRANELMQQRMDLVNSIRTDIDSINKLTAQIADLNNEIMTAEAGGHAANDLRDSRQQALNELSKLVGISYFEMGDGSVNVMLEGGATLVSGIESWTLAFQTDANDDIQVTWNGPNGYTKDVTDWVSGGQLGAHIYIRDDRIPSYMSGLNALVKDLIWEVNSVQSQGVGLSYYSNTVGTYGVSDPTAALKDNPALPFGDKINEGGEFTLYVDDSTGTAVASATITITVGMTLEDLRDAIDAALPGYVDADITSDGRLTLTGLNSHSFGFGNDTSNVVAALGINTFFTSQTRNSDDFAYTLGVNEALSADPDKVATGHIDIHGNHPRGDNSAALDMADLENQAVGPGGMTFSEAYQDLVGEIGLDTENASQQAEFLANVVDQLTQMRDSVSGVSLDEELAALIKYQRAFQAASKLITTADELYQTLLSMKT